ncbi:G-box-binding factor 4-like [Henckelia pumila]|uniref:G-box-binding factor 4-like n=1 Tax=Henckelia pumila TaxID=405737 RepID=UPI003C6E2E71
MASSKLMASSATRKSDLKRKLSACSSTSGAIDFLKSDSTSNAHDNLVTLDGFLRNAYGERNTSPDQDHRRSAGEAESCTGTLLNAEITLLDAVGAVSRSSDGEEEPRKLVRRTAEEVWREIVDGKKSGQQPKEEMMTLEDFLVKAAAKEEEEEAVAAVDVKEEKLSGGIYSYKSSGAVGIGIGVGLDVGGLGSGRGRRSLSLLEPLDKAAQQRQRRMIKNRESAARSRERKQAYQVELESMAVKLEEENERLLIEKEKLTKKRLKQLMENVIPIVEKQKPARVLRRVRSMLW